MNGNKVNPVQLVKNLTALVSGASIGDLAGLEELVGMLVKSKDLDKNCFQVSECPFGIHFESLDPRIFRD